MTSSREAASTAAETGGCGLDSRVPDDLSGGLEQHGSRSLIPRPWLPPARVFWLVLTVLVAGVFVIDFPKHSALLWAVAPEYAPGLVALGLSWSAFHAAIDSIRVLTMLAFSAVGVIIFLRRSNEWVGFATSLGLVVFGAMPVFLAYGVRVSGMWSRESTFVLALGTALAITVIFIFPDGRFYPRQTVVLAILVSFWTATWLLFPALNPYNWPRQLTTVLTPLYAVAVLFVIYRYQRTVDTLQRQQMKWVIYSFALGTLIWVIAQYPVDALRTTLSPQQNSLASFVAGVLLMLSQLLLPLAFAVAMLRYRLWDIDLIIDRTLVYLPLTGILAGVYAASMVLFQRIFQAVTGQKSDAAVVITTLLLAGAFTPLKEALQRLVERRYRQTRDPRARLQAFGQHVRSVANVFDPLRITKEALETAVAALGAAEGAVYLERHGELQLVHAYGEWAAGKAALEVRLEAQGQRLGCLQLGARRDGTVYSARDCQILQDTLAEVARVVYLVQMDYPFTGRLDEFGRTPAAGSGPEEKR